MAWIKDGLVPVAGVLLALLGFVANRDANRRQELEAKAARQQKYLEYFLANYSDTSATKQAADATTVAQQLKETGFAGEVVTAEKIPEFWDNYGWGDGNEIRYEPAGDAVAIKYFYRFIDARNPGLRFHTRAVPDPTRPSSIAVHLPPPH